MKRITIKEVIEIAIRAEELGINFYSGLARKFTKRPDIKEMFELLAKDEVEHKRNFSGLASTLADGDVELNEDDMIYLKGVDISKHFNQMDSLDDNLNPVEVMNIVLEFEKESVLYYNHIRDMVGANDTIDSIIDKEKEHVRKVMQYLITDSKFRGLEDSWD